MTSRFSIPSLFLILFSTFVYGINTDPVITLNGPNPQYVDSGGVYEELGAVAYDNEDGSLTDQIVIDGYDDWYLPTFQELLYAHSNLFLEHIYFSGIELWSSIYIGDDAYKLKLSYGGTNQASNQRVEKNLHLGQVRALPFRTVGTIY